MWGVASVLTTRRGEWHESEGGSSSREHFPDPSAHTRSNTGQVEDRAVWGVESVLTRREGVARRLTD